MNVVKQSQPIGIFDSGIGGLTVAHAIVNLLPHESIVYFGDTAHLPYGDKSAKTIQDRAIKICDFLLQQQCKIIVVACNSASAAAFTLIQDKYKDIIDIINVIDPVVQYVKDNHFAQKIGLIGTRQTVSSNIYLHKLNSLQAEVKLQSLATPLLVPMIEEGFCHNKIAKDTITEYLTDAKLTDIDSLILGCTHYPIIKPEIEEFYQQQVQVIDSPQIVATYLQNYLQEKQLLNPNIKKSIHFYVSDYNDYFAFSAERFFQQKVCLQQVVL
jgi:glutamate racemase